MSSSEAPDPPSPGRDPGDSHAVLSRAEELKIALAVACGFGEQGATENQVESVCEWARRARIGQVTLDLLLDGLVLPVGFCKGQPVFRAVEDAIPPVELIRLRAGLAQIEQRYGARKAGEVTAPKEPLHSVRDRTTATPEVDYR